MGGSHTQNLFLAQIVDCPMEEEERRKREGDGKHKGNFWCKMLINWAENNMILTEEDFFRTLTRESLWVFLNLKNEWAANLSCSSRAQSKLILCLRSWKLMWVYLSVPWKDPVILLQEKTWQLHTVHIRVRQSRNPGSWESAIDFNPVRNLPIKGQKQPSICTSQLPVNWFSSKMWIYCSHLKMCINYFPLSATRLLWEITQWGRKRLSEPHEAVHLHTASRNRLCREAQFCTLLKRSNKQSVELKLILNEKGCSNNL